MVERFTSDVEMLSGSKMRAKFDVSHGNLMLGGNGADGDLALFPAGAVQRARSADVNSEGDYSDLKWGFAASIWLDGQRGNMMLGGNGVDGDIALFPKGVRISQTSFADATIHLDGDRGDIVLRNADCAEDFDVEPDEDVEPGMVMVLTHSGTIRPCSSAHDTRVAGVISGAGSLSPALVLDRQPEREHRMPVALMGKVYCFVDAEERPVLAGDLLTTSEIRGHAMRSPDPRRSAGSILGKALRPLRQGRGIIPILVTLH